MVRTSPGVEFFRTEKIQNIMVNVLFYYSREHADLCYRQVRTVEESKIPSFCVSVHV